MCVEGGGGVQEQRCVVGIAPFTVTIMCMQSASLVTALGTYTFCYTCIFKTKIQFRYLHTCIIMSMEPCGKRHSTQKTQELLHVYSVLSSNRCGWQSSYMTQNKNNRHNINSRQTDQTYFNSTSYCTHRFFTFTGVSLATNTVMKTSQHPIPCRILHNVQ